MIEAAEEARRDSAGGKGSFVTPGLVQKAVLLDLIHLTESADKASREFKKVNSTIPWSRLSTLRNQGLVHDYPDADLDDLWHFVRDELPKLQRQLKAAKVPRL